MVKKELEKITDLIFKQLSEEEKNKFVEMNKKQRLKWLKQFFLRAGVNSECLV